MPKRPRSRSSLDNEADEEDWPIAAGRRVEVADKHKPTKHSLDSDEEDSGDDEPREQDQHVDGQEDATISMEGGVTITPFNMREELEEGHFDAEGHYHWKKEKEIKDNWLENIDWVKIQGRPEDKYKVHKDDDELKGLGDDSSSESEGEENFNLIESYKEMLSYMKEKETVLNTLRRLGPNKKVSSTERWKLKKAGVTDENAENVTKLTSVANEVLSRTGNMDVYQMTYEKIKSIIDNANKNASKKDSELDMYSDDFDVKEKKKMDSENIETNESGDGTQIDDDEESKLMWEFKWTQNDDGEVHGPHSTDQMQQWVTEGYFKSGVWVRKCGQEGPFYTSNRIDFELYL